MNHLRQRPSGRRLWIALSAAAVGIAGLVPLLSAGQAMAANRGQSVLCAASMTGDCTGSGGAGTNVVLRSNENLQDGNISFFQTDTVSNGANPGPFPVGSGLNAEFAGDPIGTIDVQNPSSCYVWTLGALNAPLQAAATCDGSLMGSKWVEHVQNNSGDLVFVNFRATVNDNNTPTYMDWPGVSDALVLHENLNGSNTLFHKEIAP